MVAAVVEVVWEGFRGVLRSLGFAGEMALKFLNKKGWHTGSLRNIETVWKAEQKHESEQKKLEELRKQIQDEREKSEFRLMQEQAGLVP